MKKCLWILSVLLSPPLWGQEQEVMRAAMYVFGASSAEELTEEQIEAIDGARPVQVNSAGLRPGVLLSAYQVASIKDYRSRSGDILSLAELALVDGFSFEAVEALKPYLRFGSTRLPGKADTVKVKSTAIARATLSNAGVKFRTEGESFRAGGAVRYAYVAPLKDIQWSLHGEWTGERLRIVAGHYNLRYGLGLSNWTGFMLASLSTVDAFSPRAPGIVPAWSYNPSDLPFGAAAEYRIGKGWQAGAFASVSGLFGGRADWYGRSGQAGLTAYYSNGFCASFDTRWSFKGVQTTFEAAYGRGSFAGKTAVLIPLGESFRLAFQGRIIPSRYSGKKNGEYAIATGFDWVSEARRQLSGVTGFGSSVPAHKASITLDASLLPVPGVDPRRLQVRGYATWQWQISGFWALDLRLTERYRNYESPRMDIRADLRFGSGPFTSALRTEAVRCEGWGLLSYLEGGYKKDIGKRLSALAAYIRITGFAIDRWNDRIYVYERDAPGTFSVPAYYGRGGAISASGSVKWRFSHLDFRINLRAAGLFRIGRPFAPTLNLQLQATF